MTDIALQIDGLDDLNARLRAVAVGHVERAGIALRGEGELVMTDAKQRTPVLTGTLRASGHVEGPDDPSAPAVNLLFGGPASEYAVYVHENLEAHHDVGEAKFLENAVLAAAPDLPQRVADRMGRL